jgi:hypothetical protein
VNIVDSIRDPKVFGRSFPAKSGEAWVAFLCALFALKMDDQQLAIYQKFTGRITPPAEPFNEGVLICGRRAGKSFILALIAVYLACFKDWRPNLARGEVATVMIVAAEKKQCRVIMRYIAGLLEAVPMLRRQIESRTQVSISLKNRVVIEIHTASMKSTRGYSVAAALLDECAFFPTDEHASPDVEILNAIRPAMATVPGSILLAASSPYSRRGILWDAFKKYHGKDDADVLVWQADTRSMNPTVPQKFIDRHMAGDPARALAEYGAQFRTDIEAFLSREAVEACVRLGVRELSPLENVR